MDEHHTIEDTAIALGEVFAKTLGNKLGIERYGFCLPMDDCFAQAAIDFGGRNWLVWETDFKREMIGKMPTEMFFHFLSSNQILHILHCNDGAWHHILNLHENERKRKNLQMIKRIVNCGIFLQDEINLITKSFEDLIEPEISYHPFLLTINNLSV